LLSGDEAIALAAWHAGVALGAGYPARLQRKSWRIFSKLGAMPMVANEKVALRGRIGAAFWAALAPWRP